LTVEQQETVSASTFGEGIAERRASTRGEGEMADCYRNSLRRIPSLLLLALPLACGVAYGQTETPPPLAGSASRGAGIRGHVSDPSGLAVPGASVTARNLLTGAEVTQETTSAGEFAFSGLAPASYALSVTGNGLAASIPRIELSSGETQDEGDVRLSLASSRQQVTVVSGSRVAELEQDSPAKVLAITREEMQNKGFERVSDVLSEVPGVVVRAQGYGVGVTTGEQIDGMDSKETLVLVDGLPIASGRGIAGGFVDLNQQGVGPLERVEVVKGAASALYGTDALGGVINLITREPSHPLELDASISGGSPGAVDGRVDIGGQWNKVSGFLDLEGHHADAYSLIPNDPSTVGAATDRQNYLAKLRYAFSPRAALGVTATGYHDHQFGFGEAFGIDPANPYAYSRTAMRGNDSTQTLALTGDFVPSQTTTLQARLYASRFLQNSGSNIIGADGVEGAQFDPGNLREDYYRGDLSGAQQLGRRNYLQGGYEWVQDEYRGDNRLVGGNAGQQLNTNDLWLQDRMQLFRNLTLTLGGRLQHNSSFGNHVVPKAGLVYRLTNNLILRGSFGLGFRAPNLGELYYHLLHLEYGYQVIGNPALRPETSQSYSAGGIFTKGRYRLSLNLFRNNLKNLIDYSLVCNATGGQNCSGDALASLLGEYGVPGSFDYDATGAALFTFVNLNVSRAYTRGFDVDGRVAISRDLAFSGAYTYLEAVDSIRHLWLGNRNRHHGHIQLEYSKPRWGLVANIRGTFFSKWPTATDPGPWAYGYSNWNVYGSKALGRGLTLFAAIDNFANSRDRKLQDAQPSFDRNDYGRTFRIGMRYSLPHRER
jgi:outer membrane receptor for ferrienterochelin and colicins